MIVPGVGIFIVRYYVIKKIRHHFVFYQLFFRDKVQEEDGYILFVRKNALQILIPKFGLEGTLYLSKKGESAPVTFKYDEAEHTQTCGNVVFRSFDHVTVQLSLDRSNVQREKLVFKLVKPAVRSII